MGVGLSLKFTGTCWGSTRKAVSCLPAGQPHPQAGGSPGVLRPCCLWRRQAQAPAAEAQGCDYSLLVRLSTLNFPRDAELSGSKVGNHSKETPIRKCTFMFQKAVA